MWEYRELIYYMVWRDFKVRYKQTVLGVGWALVQPLASVIVFTILFGRLAGLPSDGVPYPVFMMAALLPWQLFANAFSAAANSVAGNAAVISKVYFPRLIAPLAAVVATLVDFAVSLLLLFGLMVWFGVPLRITVVFLPVFMVAALGTALAVGLWAAAWNVKYRDVRYLLPYVMQLWLFLSPVLYSMSMIPEQWRTLYGFNPMVGTIQGFRWALFGGESPWFPLLISAVITVAVLTGGVFYFARAEAEFSDVI